MSPQLRFYAYTVGDEDRDALKRQLWRGEAPERKSILVLSQEQQPWLVFSHTVLWVYRCCFFTVNVFFVAIHVWGVVLKFKYEIYEMFYQLDGIQHFFSQTKWWGLFWWVDWADWSGGLGILGFKKLFGAFHARCRLGDFLISLKFVHVDIHPPPKKKTYYMMKGETLLKKKLRAVNILS